MIRIDHSKCTGCRLCEATCSLHHFENTVNSQKARIRVYMEDDLYYPVIAGPFTDAECTSKNLVVVDGQEYEMCALCRASCLRRPWFREPDTEIALKCDFCGVPPNPSCVKWCTSGALTLVDV